MSLDPDGTFRVPVLTLPAGCLALGYSRTVMLKDRLFEVLDERLTPLRERYERLIAPDSELDAMLAAGGEQARERARPILAGVRRAVGIS